MVSLIRPVLVLIVCSTFVWAQNTHDMITRRSHDMISTTIQTSQTPVQALAQKKRVLDFYGPSWCPNCPGILKDVKEKLGQEFTIQEYHDYDSYPAWILEQGQQSGWGYPMLHWTNKRGKNVVALWGGLEDFRKYDSDVDAVQSEAAPTPTREVERVLGLLPKPTVGFVDFGCGDARWCIAAAERWGCKVTGVEIDPERAEKARERVRELHLDHLITIITGDATTTEVKADVGVAYLYEDILEKLKPRIAKLNVFASYMHRPPGLSVIKNGDTWIYMRPTMQPRAAVWGGQYYSQPVCNNPGCSMCNSIRAQLRSN